MKHHTGYTNSVNQKSNNKWVPSMWDRNGSQWTSIVRCGSWGPAIYGELCHQGACRPQGWAGSRRQIRKLLKERAGGTSGYNPSYKPFNRTIDAMVEAGLLAIEQQGQYTIFKVLTPGATPEERYPKVAQSATPEEHPATPEYQGATPEYQSATPEYHSLEGEKNRIKQKDRQEGGAGGNHPGPEPGFEAQHAPPIHISECVSGAPPSTLMTPAGEEPVPDQETVDGPGPAPHSDIVQAPPGVEPALANESGPALSDDDPPPPIDDDLPDFEEEDEWQDFARESWERFLDRPIRFDPETGEPSLVPRSKEETAPVTADPEQAPAYSEESRPGDAPDPGKSSNGAIHNHYESEVENADDTDDSHPAGDPTGAPGDSGRRGGGEMSPDEDIDAKAPEPVPEPPDREKAPGIPPGQMSLLGPADGQESPCAGNEEKYRYKKKVQVVQVQEKSAGGAGATAKPTTPKEVTEYLAGMYQEITGRKARVLPKRVAMIGARLAEEFTLEDLEQALLGWWYCKFYQEDPGCRGVRAAGFIWPFTSADKVEKCMQRFVDEAPIDAVEAFTMRTGRRIPERDAEIAKAKREREKQDQEDELLAAIWAAKRQFDARREQAIFDKAYGRLMDDIRTARLYERQKPRQRSDEDIEYMWREIRERAEVIGVLDEIREKGMLPPDKEHTGGKGWAR